MIIKRTLNVQKANFSYVLYQRASSTHMLIPPRRFYTSTNTKSNRNINTTPLRGWRKYTERFKNKPASYITTFAVLHELTAIIPFPLVYYGLSWTSLHIPVPEEAVREGNRIVNKVRVKYGFEPLTPDNRAMVNLATTYAIVKVMLPLRVGASLAMTPFLAERFVGPWMTALGRLVKKLKQTTKKQQ